MLEGIDVAGVNDAGTVTGGIATAQFVMVKATEGLSWNDPRHDAIVAQARRDGRHVGHYHYAWPEHDPIAEAKHFLSRSKPQPGDLLALDLEREKGGASWARRVAYAVAWLGYVRHATGASPLLYLNGSWIDGLRAAASRSQWASLTSNPLWYAHYSGRAGVFDSRVHEWPVWTMHQFTNHPLDKDAFNGSASVWTTLGVPAKRRTVTVKHVVAAAAAGAVLAGGGTAAATSHHAPAPKPKPVVCAPAPKAKAKSKPKPVHHTTVVYYTIRRGDTLGAIAHRYRTTASKLARLNHLRNPNLIYPGHRLRVK